MAMKAARKRIVDCARAEDERSGAATKRRKAAADSLRSYVVGQWLDGKLYDEELCKLCHFITAAGGEGVESLALHEGDASRKVKASLGLYDLNDALFRWKIPVWNSDSNYRELKEIAIRLPLDVLLFRYKENPNEFDVRAQDPDDIFVPAYTEHPIVRQFGRKVVPIGLYSDKAKFSDKDSFWRVSIGITYIRKKTTCVLLKSSMLCQCGCNGKCTTDAIHVCINHSCNHLQDAINPTRRHDNTPFDVVRDDVRLARAGEPLPFMCAVIEYRGDIPERAAAAGCKNASGKQPCMCCTARNIQLHEGYASCTMVSMPWPVRTHESLLADLANQLIEVHLADRDDLQALLHLLDFKKAYPWGRAVNNTAAGRRFGLKHGDRLTIGGPIFSIHDLDKASVPCSVFFFRQKVDSALVNVSLFWDVPGIHTFGIKHFTLNCFTNCRLHTVDMGVGQRWAGESLHYMLYKDVFQTRLATKEDRQNAGALILRARLKAYYRRLRLLDPFHRITEISKFTYSMLGDGAPYLHAKGAESKHILKFVQALLMEFSSQLGEKGMHLAVAGQALLDWNAMIDNAQRMLTISERDRLIQLCVRHLINYEMAGGHFVPKHHSWVHMTQAIAKHGNCKHTSTYQDEHENGVVASVASRVHPLTFTESVFAKLIARERLDGGIVAVATTNT